jgi:hypothetical protein
MTSPARRKPFLNACMYRQKRIAGQPAAGSAIR